MAPMGSVSGWSSFIWTERYQEPGDFEIRIPTKDPDIQRQVYLYIDKFLTIPHSNETMIIEEVSYEGGRDDSALYLRGRDAKTILDRRVIVGTTIIPYGPTADEIVRTIFATEIANPSELSRQIDLLQLDNPSSWTAYRVDYDPKGKTVWDFFLHCARIYQCGIRTYRQGNKIRVQFWRPTDRSVGKANVNPVVFREKLGNLTNAVYRKATKSYRTTALVHVEGGANSSVKITEAVSNRYAIGLNRREVWVTPNWDYQSQLQDNAGVRATLRPYGIASLYEHAFYDQIQGEVSRDNIYNYGLGKDYFLGDTVSVEIAGQRSKARVTEYTFSWTVDGGYKGYPTLDAAPEISTNL